MKKNTEPTFNQSVKQEIIKNIKADACCTRALFCAMLPRGEISVAGSRVGFVYKTRTRYKYDFFHLLAAKIFPNLKTQENGGLAVWTDDVREKLVGLGLINYEGGIMNICESIPPEYRSKDCCARSYLRGLFVEYGAIKIPSADARQASRGGYHLEIRFDIVEAAVDCIQLFREYGFEAGLTSRADFNVVYFKNAEVISDLLAMFCAMKSVLTVNASVVARSVRADANRRVNCDSANIDKSIAASSAQIEAIRRIENKEGLNSLPRELREIALLRLDNPDASIKEIADLAGLSKSGADHRLKRLLVYDSKES